MKRSKVIIAVIAIIAVVAAACVYGYVRSKPADELESLLFCVQTGIGVGVIAFFLGRFVERKKQETARGQEKEK